MDIGITVKHICQNTQSDQCRIGNQRLFCTTCQATSASCTGEMRPFVPTGRLSDSLFKCSDLPAKIAIILMGIQASGKSTFCLRCFCGEIFEHISLDIQKTRNREYTALQKCIAEDRSFVVDNTNPTKEDRARYIIPAKENGYTIIGYYFRSSISESIARNEKRDQRVPNIAIANTSNRLELPAYSEGYDELWYVSLGEDGSFVCDEWRERT